VLRPQSHQLPSHVEKGAAAIGRLDLIADGVGQRHFTLSASQGNRDTRIFFLPARQRA
jgi:hypothetical protein